MTDTGTVISRLAPTGTATYAKTEMATRSYRVTGALAPSALDPAALAVACAAGTPLRDVTFAVRFVGERVAVRTS